MTPKFVDNQVASESTRNILYTWKSLYCDKIKFEPFIIRKKKSKEWPQTRVFYLVRKRVFFYAGAPKPKHPAQKQDFAFILAQLVLHDSSVPEVCKNMATNMAKTKKASLIIMTR